MGFALRACMLSSDRLLDSNANINAFGWFFDLESQLTEIIASRKEPEAYNAFIKTVSFLTECQDPCTAGHQKRVSELAEGIAREMGFS